MLLYISDPSSSLQNLLNLLNEFGQLSGYKVNYQKSELMPVGPMTPDVLSFSIPFKITTTKFKYLGIWFTKNFKELYKANYQPLLASMKQDFER